MTLIAAFRCAEGVVLCADSQETVDIPERGQYRVRVEKIKPQDAGEYQVVIGGAGDGSLVDGFTDTFVERVAQWQGKLDGLEIKTRIKQLLHDYHRNEIALSRAFEDDKFLSFVICVKHKEDTAIFL